jgi:hypothetical protein
MLPKRFAPALFGLILSGLMSLLVSGISTYRALGFSDGYVPSWTGAWLTAWLIAFPVVLVAAPLTPPGCCPACRQRAMMESAPPRRGVLACASRTNVLFKSRGWPKECAAAFVENHGPPSFSMPEFAQYSKSTCHQVAGSALASIGHRVSGVVLAVSVPVWLYLWSLSLRDEQGS